MQRAVEGTGSNKANLDDYHPFDAQKNVTIGGNNAGMCKKMGLPKTLVYTLKNHWSCYKIFKHYPVIVGGGPAVMNPSTTHEEAPPTYTKSGQQQITTADFQVYHYFDNSDYDIL